MQGLRLNAGIAGVLCMIDRARKEARVRGFSKLERRSRRFGDLDGCQLLNAPSRGRGRDARVAATTSAGGFSTRRAKLVFYIAAYVSANISFVEYRTSGLTRSREVCGGERRLSARACLDDRGGSRTLPLVSRLIAGCSWWGR